MAPAQTHWHYWIKPDIVVSPEQVSSSALRPFTDAMNKDNTLFSFARPNPIDFGRVI